MPSYEKPFDGVVQQFVGPAVTRLVVVVTPLCVTKKSRPTVTWYHACRPVYVHGRTTGPVALASVWNVQLPLAPQLQGLV